MTAGPIRPGGGEPPIAVPLLIPFPFGSTNAGVT